MHLWPGDIGTAQIGPFCDVETFYPEVTGAGFFALNLKVRRRV